MRQVIQWVKEGFQRHLALPTVLATAFVVLVVTLAFFKPMARVWQTKLEEVRAERIKLLRHRVMVNHKDAYLNELAQYEKSFTRQQSHDQEVATFSQQLDQFSNGAGLKINEIRPIGGEERGGVDVIAIELIVEGEMTQLVQFLYAIASSPDLLEIQSLDILRRRTGNGRLAITAQVTKTLFVS